VDIWSFGVIAYTLLVGRPPFETSDLQTTYRRIKTCSYSFPDSAHLSHQAISLISSILVLDPSKRLSLKDIEGHRFFATPLPSSMPMTTLACPPADKFVTKYASHSVSQPKIQAQERPPRLNNFLEENGHAGVYASSKNMKRGVTVEKECPGQVRDPPRSSVDHGRSTHSLQRCNTASSALNKARLNLNPHSNLQSVALSWPEVWVVKYIDYSSKFGLGYILNTGAPGAFFNDQTKLVADHRLEHFVYLERKPGTRDDTAEKYAVSAFPEALNKKLKLIKHFRTHLLEKAKESD
jgi:polo-like kinase 1